jgi:ribose transport system substrate-binding protein
MVNRFTKLALPLILAASSLVGSAMAANAGSRVTMIAYPPGDDFYFTIENGARKQAEASGVDLTILKIPSYDMAAQVATLNAAIAARPDAILVSPLDPNGLQASLDRAKAQGIKVVLYDTTTRDPSVAATFVSADVVEMGRNAAREFQKHAGDKKGPVFYQGTATAMSYFESLKKGWNEVLGDSPNYTSLPVNYSDFEPSKAASQMQAVLSSNPDLIGGFAGIFLDQQGIIPAIERAGKAGELIVIGTDGAPQNVQRVRDGKLQALVSNKAVSYGVEGIKAAVAAIEGKELPAHTVIGQCVLTKETLDDPANADCLYDLDK